MYRPLTISSGKFRARAQFLDKFYVSNLNLASRGKILKFIEPYFKKNSNYDLFLVIHLKYLADAAFVTYDFFVPILYVNHFMFTHSLNIVKREFYHHIFTSTSPNFKKGFRVSLYRKKKMKSLVEHCYRQVLLNCPEKLDELPETERRSFDRDFRMLYVEDPEPETESDED